ncbi:quinohemoprotein amine dehydrogenase subunit alpha [Azohydromonas caseinilytica]|uniref:Quinohemoprotein amine dehydrogenase subunit alpha n=1 Tax=Azohydromonas caseinilytica TaxID=2728836 RepID=A0A848FHV2_9BURK|nr:quinohemoprotein amine dehydrogenase subunit alpha [Azohydromonas caseinilytica]NML18726.1 quinohemoprotein amine dehydrogenase subunit alpha [Azohydromonas caseinilytica]
MYRVSNRLSKAYSVALAAAGLLAALGAGPAWSAESVLSGQDLINTKCVACHAAQGENRWFRISDGRRTPEGWDMTVVRMEYAHGVKLSTEERQAVVKYLADNFGLAPQETQDRRYILERRPNFLERAPASQVVADTCTRCHSAARIELQRRTPQDWGRLVNFHVGQFPSIEYSAGGRDRNWFDIASKEVVGVLAKLNTYDTPAWRAWQAAPAADPSGRWRVAGYRPGWGAYEGEAQIQPGGEDRYAVAMTLRYADGRVEKAEGRSLVYTKHEWRASLRQGETGEVKQVLGIEPGGQRMAGRWFAADNDVLGGDLVAVRAEAQSPAVILSVQPAALRAGETRQLTIHGANLDGDLQLGPDLRVLKVVERQRDRLVVEVAARSGARDGLRSVRVGEALLAGGLPVYRRVDYVKVEPEHPFARLGGNGGSRAKMPAQLEAIGYASGPDGKRGTKDDIRIGALPAQWSLDNLHAAAAEMGDLDFAVGRIEANGLFWPADAGPNPARRFGTNNAGELKATARVSDGRRQLSASVPLYVTVQRWNDPPIR